MLRRSFRYSSQCSDLFQTHFVLRSMRYTSTCNPEKQQIKDWQILGMIDEPTNSILDTKN